MKGNLKIVKHNFLVRLFKTMMSTIKEVFQSLFLDISAYYNTTSSSDRE